LKTKQKVSKVFVVTLPVNVMHTSLVTHAFVYWENEDAGTLVPLSAIEEKNPVVGMITKVKSGGGKHDGKIIALG